MKVASRAQRGFTLFELMITLAVAGTLAAIAVPNMRDFMRNNRLSSAANDMLRSVQVARSEAVKRQAVVAVCASNAPDAANPTCSDGALSGWIIFVDANTNWNRDGTEAVLERKSAPAGISISNNQTGKVSYSPTGFATSTAGQTPTSRVVICDSRGNRVVGANSVARALVIEATGRARITRDPTEITNALTATGGSCT
jgi:type IV fimbrial biogenesis protein FimT